MIGGFSQRLHDRGQVVDRLGDGRVGDHLRVLAERLHLDLEARVRRSEHPVPLGLVVRRPSSPRTRGVIQSPWTRTMVSGAAAFCSVLMSFLSMGSPPGLMSHELDDRATAGPPPARQLLLVNCTLSRPRCRRSALRARQSAVRAGPPV